MLFIKSFDEINEGYQEIQDVSNLAGDILYSLARKLNNISKPSKSNYNYIFEFDLASTTIEESIKNISTFKTKPFKSNKFKDFCDNFKNLKICFKKGIDRNAYYDLNRKIILFISDEKELELNKEFNIDTNKTISARDIYMKIYNKFNTILEHELQHAFDDYISKGKAFNVKKSKNDSEFDHSNYDDAMEYLNLPYEINARFTQAINSIHFLELEDFTDDNKTIERPYKFTKVLREFFKVFNKSHISNPKIKNTIIKRLYNIYNKAIETAKADTNIILID